jgi:hypothetical protein
MRCLGGASTKADLRSENVQRAAISNKITAASQNLFDSDTFRKKQGTRRKLSSEEFAMICTSRADARKEGARIVRTDANRTDWSFGKR